jgi:broad specificity phosphatase PhoE
MILLRHGQSEFNLHFTATRRDPGIEDPRLTELGHRQAEQAAEALLAETGGRIRRILASPYTRALLTALGHAQAEEAAEALADEGLRRIIASPYTRALQTAAPLARATGLPVTIQPLVRERYAFACDIGTPRSRLALEWPEHDLSHVDDVWWPAMEEPADQVEARAALFRQEMSALEDWAETVVITHWGFVMSMTGRSIDNCQWLRVDPTAPPPAEISWKHG